MRRAVQNVYRSSVVAGVRSVRVVSTLPPVCVTAVTRVHEHTLISPRNRIHSCTRTMATSASSEATSTYAAGPFPPIPRLDGTAEVVCCSVSDALTQVGSPAQAAIVRFVTKAQAASAAPAASLASSDAEHESVLVSYESSSGGEVRVIRAVTGKKLTVESLRAACVAAVNKAKALKLKQLVVELPEGSDALPVRRLAETVVHTCTLTNYAFDRYVTTAAKVPTTLSKLFVCPGAGAGADDLPGIVRRASTLSSATVTARDVANERADEMHPARVEAIARSIASSIPHMSVHSVVGADLVPAGLHLMSAVGQAARHPPRYVEIVYDPPGADPADVILLVGKGICFDSGGLNIKGTGFMEDMHMDKGGAAAVLGAAVAAGRLQIPRKIVYVLALAENAIDALAYKPHAVIRSHKGLTVEIGNTDAEGRLVLADALSFAQQRHKPHTVIDFATLTGACVVALGEYAAGVFSNNKKLAAALVGSGERVFERCWHMPILPEHKEELTGTPYADLKSTGEGRYGGACTAAAFLENFIGHEPSKNAREASVAAASDAEAPAVAKVAWAHVDIAGPGMYGRDRGHMKKGGTGFGVQMVIDYITNAPAGAPPADE